MNNLTLNQFCGAIEMIRTQMARDKKCSEMIAQVFNTENMGLYDNSGLIKTIISLLQVRFPKVNGHCDIEHFVFELNFGKIGDNELITPEDLWFQLTKTD